MNLHNDAISDHAMNELAAAAHRWLHDQASQGVFTTDTALTIQSWNPWLETHSGWAAVDVIGRKLTDVFPELKPRHLDQWYGRALNGQVVVLSHALHRYVLPLPPIDRSVPFEFMQQSGRIAPLFVDSQIVGTITILDDVTERVVREDELKRQVEAQLFLSRASSTLGISLDFDETLNAFARVALPRLGDLVIVDLLQDDQSLQRAAVAHVDPAKEQVARQLNSTILLPADDAAEGQMGVMQSGTPLLVAEIDAATWDALPAHQRDVLAALQLHSLLVIPFSTRAGPLGVLTFAVTESERRYTAADLDLARELGHRAALAVENAQLYRAAQIAIKLREEFLSIAAHELKTPITGLIGYIQLLQRRLRSVETIAERDQRILGRLGAQADRLQALVAELLDVSRIDLGHFYLRQQSVDLAVLMHMIVDELEPMLVKHTIAFEYTGEPVVVDADRMRLEQVFHNLLQNAIKYSPNGGTITIRLTGNQTSAVVAISDEGVGIPLDAQPQLFQRFYRAGNAEDSWISGFGIGLYLVKEIVSRHGGTISVQSTENQGSTFTVELPLAQPPQNQIM